MFYGDLQEQDKYNVASALQELTAIMIICETV